jgi:hypothetical protein
MRLQRWERCARALVRGGLAAGGALVVLAGAAGPARAFDSVPGIDPAPVAGAVTLLVGGLLVLAGRFRRR